MGASAGPRPCPGTFAAPRRPLPGPGRGTPGRAPGSYGRLKSHPGSGRRGPTSRQPKQSLQSGRKVSQKWPPGFLERVPGPRQARADGSGSGLQRSGMSSRRVRTLREAPGPRLKPVASTVGSSTRGGWSQLLMLPGAPAASQPGHSGSRKSTGRTGRSPGLGRRPRPSLPVPSFRVSEIKGRLDPRGSHCGD